MAKGTIRKLMDRGFGFIKTEDGTDLFFHSNELEGVEFNSLSEGQEVEYGTFRSYTKIFCYYGLRVINPWT